MVRQKAISGMMFVVVLALLGAALIYVPPQLVSQYEKISTWGRGWVIAYFGIVGSGGLLLFGSSGYVVWKIWIATRRKAQRRELRAKDPRELSAAERQREMDANLASVEDLRGDPAVTPELKLQLQPLLDRFARKRENHILEIVAFGTISSGKSSLLNALAGQEVFQTEIQGGTTVDRNEIPWAGSDRVMLVDTPGLGEVDGARHGEIAAESARDADIVLLVVDGPLRDGEVDLLRSLVRMEKRVLVCLNKLDWFAPTDREKLLGQIRDQLRGLVRADDVIAVQSRSVKRERVRMSADGSQSSEEVEQSPDIEPLARRMMQVIQRDGHDLLLANLLLQSRGLVTEARERLQEALDARASSIIESHTWAAGGAAALSPTPVLDLLAGSAITVRMVVELARAYRQEVDMEVATRLLGQLGKNLIAILGVSAATPALSTAVAQMLKTIPGAGTIAGGVLQGIVQALVTRWIGSVFQQYFKQEMRTPPEGLAEIAREQWKKLTSIAELRQLVSKARSNLFRPPPEA